MDVAVQAEGLRKSFGSTKALDGLDLTVPHGTILGLLGPNGAGKTTAVRILTTLLIPDAGRAFVAGVDVLADPTKARRLIGLTGQFAALDDYLTGRENLIMFGRLYHLSRAEAKRRADQLLERFDLTDAAGRLAKTYSGGMRRRLDIAASLIARPPVLFLDEPTTGLDPRSRLGMWEVMEGLVRDGTTMLLTTQYLRGSRPIGRLDRGHRRRPCHSRGNVERPQGSGRRHSPRAGRRVRRGGGPCGRDHAEGRRRHGADPGRS